MLILIPNLVSIEIIACDVSKKMIIKNVRVLRTDRPSDRRCNEYTTKTFYRDASEWLDASKVRLKGNRDLLFGSTEDVEESKVGTREGGSRDWRGWGLPVSGATQGMTSWPNS